jgi:hypothetical protein
LASGGRSAPAAATGGQQPQHLQLAGAQRLDQPGHHHTAAADRLADRQLGLLEGVHTIATAAWMRFRRHGRAAIAEMAVAMYAPFVVLFPPLGWGCAQPPG